ncbi:unnamed protein product [Parnassius apollo]|uniref:Protein-lysine N-methyltransferase PAPOLLO_LOCUS4717 n=1 Tax=Parnassius apollo TaxID=110799 RepID=A0A8S3WCZ1_PARAO|nr:unnamed protein product [Parnassius apollo]
MDDTELEPSELGTRPYWQKAYTEEIINFEERGDPGDIWFGEDSVYRVIKWISQRGVPKDTAVIDLGCGNGYTLYQLAWKGFTNLLGVDYCQEAIVLAGKVAQKQFPFIKLQVFDILNDDVKDLGGKFGLVHDKGTYDAVSLNPNNPRRQRQKYIEQVTEMLADNGFFVITSCNWTESELFNHFSEKMKFKCVIPTPQFTFGGTVGSMVTSVVFVK